MSYLPMVKIITIAGMEYVGRLVRETKDQIHIETKERYAKFDRDLVKEYIFLFK